MEFPSTENNSCVPATLPKAERLAGRSAVDNLFREGKGGFVYPFRYIFKVETSGEEATARILFSVPKRYHKRANKRNLLKRRSRESYRQAKSLMTERLADGQKELRIALIYSSKEIEPYAKIDHAIRRIISEINRRL